MSCAAAWPVYAVVNGRLRSPRDNALKNPASIAQTKKKVPLHASWGWGKKYRAMVASIKDGLGLTAERIFRAHADMFAKC